MNLIYFNTRCTCSHEYCDHLECGGNGLAEGCLTEGCKCTRFERATA